MPEPAPPASLTAAAVDDADAATARAAMVARLLEAGHLWPGPVSEALLALPRQALMPQAYVRRCAPDETPPRWDLLDWSVPEDRDELLRLLYSGDSVAVQHDGEPLLGRARGTRRLALDHLRPGLVRNFGAEHLQIGAPECGSWVRVTPEGDGTCSVTEFGPRGIWHEIEEIAARWQAAGAPDAYRIEFHANGAQRVVVGSGRNKLCWPLRDERSVKGDLR
jgi:hypothetical protein